MSDAVKCPNCGSHQIYVAKRGWSLMGGMLGSSKVVLTCMKCGHKFEPGQGA
jgi:DNA-directed RNA polymerase subunit RPC12/RpoP